MWRLCTASLFCVAGSVTSERVPASLPVPDVVGTCARALRRPATFSGPTTSWMVWPLPGSTAASLARSIALPPPKPTTRSGCVSSAMASSASRLGMSGSGLTVPNTVTLPGSASTSTRLALKASATTRMRLKPCSRAQAPTVGASPEPNRRTGGRWISIGVDEAHAATACGGRGGQLLGVFDRLDQALLVGDALADDVEGGAVVDGGADDRQAERDVDAGEVVPLAGGRVDLEAEQLDRDVALVVVVGDHGVVLAGAQLHEHGVARARGRRRPCRPPPPAR